ncbi:tetratricopeptide repeat protein [Rhizosaccharibacter radicis]|uniref:Tetratricopeptide repeat protein n=1 Tax=Rhizosaccharibacter radicis TaxID=2782605 RepID=A0ABT1VTX7_9PROT|nr:tetratricopeptide repeat protein [Acetobacteraceae bacterium KSS12]
MMSIMQIEATASSRSSRERLDTLKRAFAALQEGSFAPAAEIVASLAADENDLEARLVLGLGLGGSGRADAAAPLLCDIAGRRPDAMHPCVDLAGLLRKQGRLAAAEPCFRDCLALTPDQAGLLLGWGNFLCDMFRFAEAETALRRCLEIRPRLPGLLNQLGVAVASQGRSDDGITIFQEAVARVPEDAPAWANLACTLSIEGRFEESLAAFHRSIRLRPDDPQIRLNHSICLLKAERMTQGWSEHEWRLKLPGHTDLPPERLMPTLGPDTDLTGQTVLVTHEEGFGDTLLFLRYLPLLKRRGATVIASVPPMLARLVARCDGIDGVVTGDEARTVGNWHCPFISLPRVFSGTGDAWGISPPYLHTDPASVEAAARHLPPGDRLRVGLVWGGAPREQNPAAHAIDRKRSMPLRTLAPLAALRDVHLISVQKGPYAEELSDPPDGLRIHDPMPTVDDMDDTASLMRSLDVVVTVDTSMVHLAGGLGIPALLMDRYDNCWRWFHGREDSPWYPSVRIIRQSSFGDWDGVVRRVLPMLQAMADQKMVADRFAATWKRAS